MSQLQQIPKKLFAFIKKNFPKNKVRYRRDFYKLLDFVRALALFNNRNVATSDDYDKAKDIFINAFSTSANLPLKDIDERIVKVLERNSEPIQAKFILNEIGGIITIQALYPRLRNLVMKEVLEEQADRLGGYVVQNYTLTEEFKDKTPFKLPNYEEMLK